MSTVSEYMDILINRNGYLFRTNNFNDTASSLFHENLHITHFVTGQSNPYADAQLRAREEVNTIRATMNCSYYMETSNFYKQNMNEYLYNQMEISGMY